MSIESLTSLQLLGILITLAALLMWLNRLVLRLPTTIGLMLLALIGSLTLWAIGLRVPAVGETAREVITQIDFDAAVLDGMLGFLLFAGALHVKLQDLWQQKGIIFLMATVGVLISTAAVAALTYGASHALVAGGVLGAPIPFMYCLLFGAIVSPTDPIAVLAIMRSLGVPRGLATKITGESLFNDGVGVVVFLALLSIAGLGGHGGGAAQHEQNPSATTARVPADVSRADVSHAELGHAELGHDPVEAQAEHDGDYSDEAGEVATLFVQEVVGGIGMGLLLGTIGFLMLWPVDEFRTETLITLAIVAGGYALAQALHFSGPLAMVVAGLLIGNKARQHAFGKQTARYLDQFWEMVDELLNAVLFVLIGLEVLVISFDRSALIAGLVAIPLVLIGRVLAVYGPMTALSGVRSFTPHAGKVLVWGGLKGAISVALALVLREALVKTGDEALLAIGDLLLTMTYCVVAFSILIQGLTTGPLIAALGMAGDGAGEGGEDGLDGDDGFEESDAYDDDNDDDEGVKDDWDGPPIAI